MINYSIQPASVSNNASRDLSEREDSALWQALKSGDVAALELLYKRHYDALFNYAVKFCRNSELAEDHIHNLFLKIWENRDSLSDVRGVKTYLWTALRRSLITALVKENRNVQLDEEESGNEAGFHFHYYEIITDHELNENRKKKIAESLNKLSNKQREAIFLKFYEGMSYDEIELIMQVSYQTARNYICEGIKSLKRYSQLSSSMVS